MKIYCGIPFIGIGELKKSYELIYQYVSELGHEHVDKEFLVISQQEWLKKMDSNKKQHEDLYRRKMKSIQQAEICIFEVSFHSIGIGFMIQRALEDGKPCIILYQNDKIPFLISGINNEKLIIKSYTEKNMKRILKQSIHIAKERRDKRFNFYLSTKLLEHIEVLSKHEGTTKSKVMRDIILRDMKNRSDIN